MKNRRMPGRARHDGIALVLILLLGACSAPEPTIINGSTPTTFASTAAEAREELSAADRLAFDQALASVGGRRHSAENADQLRRTTFDGMTGAEVVEDHRRRTR